MLSLCFRYGLPMVFTCLPYAFLCFPMLCLWLCYAVPMPSYTFPMLFPYTTVLLCVPNDFVGVAILSPMLSQSFSQSPMESLCFPSALPFDSLCVAMVLLCFSHGSLMLSPCFSYDFAMASHVYPMPFLWVSFASMMVLLCCSNTFPMLSPRYGFARIFV